MKKDTNNRPLTTYEKQLLKLKCENWSFSLNLHNGYILLSNGIDNKIRALLPLKTLLIPRILNITLEHVLVPRIDILFHPGDPIKYLKNNIKYNARVLSVDKRITANNVTITYFTDNLHYIKTEDIYWFSK